MPWKHLLQQQGAVIYSYLDRHGGDEFDLNRKRVLLTLCFGSLDRQPEDISNASRKFMEEAAYCRLSKIPVSGPSCLHVFKWQVLVESVHAILDSILLHDQSCRQSQNCFMTREQSVWSPKLNLHSIFLHVDWWVSKKSSLTTQTFQLVLRHGPLGLAAVSRWWFIDDSHHSVKGSHEAHYTKYCIRILRMSINACLNS